MAKSSTKKMFRSLFSKSEASLDKEVDKTEGEKKSFKFLKFKSKSKSGSEKAANEKQQVISAAEPDNTAEDKETRTGNSVSKSKSFSLYSFSSRSKGKEFSYSEMDLRKPKKFGTFSLGLRKKKKKDHEILSQSTYGLHRRDIEEETPQDLHQMELEQANLRLSMSQPELDSSEKFNIPSPPPLAKNRSESYFQQQWQPAVINTQSGGKGLLNERSDLLDVAKAQMSTIPELQLKHPGSSEEKENIPLDGTSPKRDSMSSGSVTPTESNSLADYDTETLHPSMVLDAQDRRPSAVDSISWSTNMDTILPSDPNEEDSPAESTVPSSHHQPERRDPADGTAPNAGVTPASSDTESIPALIHGSTLWTDPALVPQEISISHTERSDPETIRSVIAIPSVGGEKTPRPVNHTDVYGALYESLLPQSFTSDVMSALPMPAPQINTEVIHLRPKSEPVMIKTLDQRHTETNVVSSRPASSYDSAAVGSYTDRDAILSERNVNFPRKIFSSTPMQSSTASQPPGDPTEPSSEPGGSSHAPRSELTVSHSEVISDSFSLFSDAGRSVPVVPCPAPPVPEYATSQGADSQVTESTRRVILVRESLSNDASMDTSLYFSLPEKLIQAAEPPRGMGTYDGTQSPSYLSVGSDDGSFMDVYYSAEEDNTGTEDEEMFMVANSEEICFKDGVKEVVGLPEETPRWREETPRWREETQHWRDDTPRRRDDTPRRREDTPRQREETLRRWEETPRWREDTPRRREESPQRREEIPQQQEEIPQRREVTQRQEETPQRREESPQRREEIPQRREESPQRREESPQQREEIPQRREVTQRQEESPQQREEIPQRREVTQRQEESPQQREEIPQRREVTQRQEESPQRREVTQQQEESPQRREVTHGEESKRDDRQFKGVIVKMQNEGGKMGSEEEKEGSGRQTEVQQRPISRSPEARATSELLLLVASDTEIREEEVATGVFPQVNESGREETKEELVDTPVRQVNTLMVCDLAPPSGELHAEGEGSGGNRTEPTEDHRNGEDQLPCQETQYLTYKRHESSESKHAPNTRETDPILPKEADGPAEGSRAETNSCSNFTTSAAADTSAAVEPVASKVTRSAQLQSDATEVEHNRAPPRAEWVDTVTQSTESTGSAPQQAAAELSTAEGDDPTAEAAEIPSERREHPDQHQGSLTTSRSSPGAPEVLAAENRPAKVDPDPAGNMNSVYSSLSTKLIIRSSSSPNEDQSKHRVRKVSLIRGEDTPEESQDTLDFSRTSTTDSKLNGADSGSEYKWRNQFEGVYQYNPRGGEDSSFSDSLSQRMSDSSSSHAFTETTANRYLGNAFTPTSTSSLPPEEHVPLGNRLSDRPEVYLSRRIEPAEEGKDEWRRSIVERVEPAAPVSEREQRKEGESERIKSHWESIHSSAQKTSYDYTGSFAEVEEDDSQFSGVFQATLVELVSDPAVPPSSPPASPDADSPNQFDMDMLVDTLKSMGPALRPRATSIRSPAPALVPILPPIVEDAPSPVTSDVPDAIIMSAKKMHPDDSLNGIYKLPSDLGLMKSSIRDKRSPLELIRQQNQQDQPGVRDLDPSLGTTTNSTLMRKTSDSSSENFLNGNIAHSPASRLDNSVIFGSNRSVSIEHILENRQNHRPLFHTSSLPETGLFNDRTSTTTKEHEMRTGADQGGSRLERLSFLLKPSSSISGSLTGFEERNERMSWPPQFGISSPPSSNSPTRLLSPTGTIDLHRPFAAAELPKSLFGQVKGMGAGTGRVGSPILQTSISNEGNVAFQPTPLFKFDQVDPRLHSQTQLQNQEPERNLVSKYRAFPDAYLTKEKEHGKLNPRPGKLYIFDQPGMRGRRIEVRSDVIDATPWELQETISIRVVRGGWVLYEKPNFKGEKIALDEGDVELAYPFSPPEEQQEQNGPQEAAQQNGELADPETESDAKPARRFIIGSIRRTVRDYSVPEISLFPEENAEGKKVTFRDTSEDARIFGFPIKANSIIINAGLWLVYAHPFFQGAQRVLEVGGYVNPAAWGVETPYVGSLHPLKIGEPRVENIGEPKMVVYEKPYFIGKTRTISANTRDFLTRKDRNQTAFMHNVGSLKVEGGIWVGYEKEGFRGHQYVLEEGEYHDWRAWGGCDAEMRSVRVIQADLTEPLMVMFEQPEAEEDGKQEENSFEVSEAIPDVELFGYKTSTQTIHVLSGAWIAYSHVDFSGRQYILEKGFYNNCADWGAPDNRLCSVQPIRPALSDASKPRNKIWLYPEPDFKGECLVNYRNQEELSETLVAKSCRVSGASWAVYDDKNFSGNMCILSEGDYPNSTSMGCPPEFTLRSIKAVPMKFCIPSISLFGLECLEGREITTDTQIVNMFEEGLNNHIMSLRVNSGCWVICEYSNYRGRQFLLEAIEITNWQKFSSFLTTGSMYPVRQKRYFFHIKNKESGHFMSIQGGVEEMKAGRVVVTAEVEPMSDIWFYQDGFIKNKLSPNMSLQVVGNIEQGAKLVLWTETRQPIQTWTTQMRGLITSLTFPGMVLDVKGGKSYDKEHLVIYPENEERSSQQWEIHLL